MRTLLSKLAISIFFLTSLSLVAQEKRRILLFDYENQTSQAFKKVAVSSKTLQITDSATEYVFYCEYTNHQSYKVVCAKLEILEEEKKSEFERSGKLLNFQDFGRYDIASYFLNSTGNYVFYLIEKAGNSYVLYKVKSISEKGETKE